eukprot:CAMPEP_0179448346 /NCGR_PEP_ID=MMETSP0799-20121207/32192_1 /TAXON_ID=46947 /ORGANISM="Geminigera cryophila, Strain CCMP2564" /LENGTH=442 /DNA_ID=CAMNT_0021240097 /DNA_START=208 /DNA_END=1536 /DNA_ORIENTATION=-
MPTADGAVWQTGRFPLPLIVLPSSAGGASYGRQSSRLAGKSCPSACEVDEGAGPRVPCSVVPNVRANFAPSSTAAKKSAAKCEKGGKRKREEEAVRQSEPKAGKEKKHDKYCHFCQHVKVSMMACESGDCTHRFCTYCLAVHLGVDTDPASGSTFKAGAWHCPTCISGCCCSQPECNKAHRHCKAFRYRCRRAAAASLRMSAAHALVSLGVMATGKGKNKTLVVPGAHAQSSHQLKKATQEGTDILVYERPAKRRESPLPLGPSDESDKLSAMVGAAEEAVWTGAISKDEQMEIDAGESAVGVLASLSMRSPSPSADDSARTSEYDDDDEDDDDGVAQDELSAPDSTGSLEKMALFALQSLAAMAPIRERSPSQPSEQPSRELSEDSSLDTPRTVVDCSRDRHDCTRSKMAIDQLMSLSVMKNSAANSSEEYEFQVPHAFSY